MRRQRRPRRGGHRRGKLRGGPRSPRRQPAAVADRVGRVAGRVELAEPGPGCGFDRGRVPQRGDKRSGSSMSLDHRSAKGNQRDGYARIPPRSALKRRYRRCANNREAVACAASITPPRCTGGNSPTHHGHDLEHWPLRDTLTLGALPDAVPLARAHLRQLLSGWGRAGLGPDAGVVVSELVTNSVAASAGLRLAAASVLVWLGSDSRAFSLPWQTRAPASGSAEPAGGHRRGARAGAGGSAQQPVGLAPGQHHRADEVIWAEWRLPSGAGRRSATGVPLNRRCHLAEE